MFRGGKRLAAVAATIMVVLFAGVTTSSRAADISLDWTKPPFAFSQLATWDRIVHGNGRFVALGQDGRSMASTDGITWTGANGPDAFFGRLSYGNGNFLTASSSGSNRIAKSTDGTNWTYSPGPTGNWSVTAYGNGTWVVLATGPSPQVSTSTDDGSTWTAPSTLSGVGANYNNMVYGGGRFVAVAAFDNKYMTSTDGINWTGGSIGMAARALTYGNGTWVAVGYGDKVATSTDGTNWTVTTLARTSNWSSVAYGNGKFLAVSSGGDPMAKAMTSTDGINWDFDGAAPFHAVVVGFGGGRFVGLQMSTNDRVMYTDGSPPTTTTTVAPTTVAPTTVAPTTVTPTTTASAGTSSPGGATTTTSTSPATQAAAPATSGSTANAVAALPASTVETFVEKSIVTESVVYAGDAVSVSAEGFSPNEAVTVGIVSSPTSTKSVTASSAGSIDTKVAIPSTSSGSVTVYAYGRTSKYGVRQDIVIATLPDTGSDTSGPVRTAFLLIAVGATVVSRRRWAVRTNR
jgi:hypothetical protein